MDSGAPQLNGGRILVVDDEATMRRLLEKLLRLEGYDVALASSGEQALQEVFARGADTVLLDMRLPGMSGLDVCRNIRSHPRGYTRRSCSSRR
ncbi:response regulator transcription factor [Nannocystis pusilla]|uniref:response regulator transcription factor n=1 Tax=Nannocystis pusilla TaxID=889268 RepID=UPI003B780545